MPDDLTWTREPRTSVETATTPVGTYRMLYSGYDYIVTRDHQRIGRGYRQTALTVANNDHSRLMSARNVAVATEPGPAILDPEDPRITALVQAVVDEIDWADGSNGHAEIMLGIAKGLDAAGLYLAPRKEPHA